MTDDTPKRSILHLGDRLLISGETTAPSPVAETVDTSAEAVERLARTFDGDPGGPTCFAARVGSTLRALLAERDAAVAVVALADALSRDAEEAARVINEMAAERRHLIAEMTKRGLLSVLQEIDHEWLAQSAAHAETHHAP